MACQEINIPTVEPITEFWNSSTGVLECTVNAIGHLWNTSCTTKISDWILTRMKFFSSEHRNQKNLKYTQN